ncbi:hypothetical protein [Spirochaeta lutea]|uniref:hypothetical protein n=1 Tax=Spirochaeta lutea TaxID=1480694 RepID=UPI0012E0921C|nr:hypothetical protein [Spirochaeta lutea]
MKIPDSPTAQRELLKKLSQIPWPDEQAYLVRTILSSHSTLEEKLTVLTGLAEDFPDIAAPVLQGRGDSNKPRPKAMQEATPPPGERAQPPETHQDSHKDAPHPASPGIPNTPQGSAPGREPTDNPPDTPESPPGMGEEPEPPPGSGDEPELPNPGDEAGTPREIAKNRKTVLTVHQNNGFLQYIFEDIWKIIPFARDTGVIEGHFLFLTIRLSPTIEQTMTLSLQKRTLQPLDETLSFILRKGWKALSKSHYNLLRLIQDLSRAILAIDFTSLPYQSREIHGAFQEVLALFCVYIYLDPRLDHTADALRRAYQAMPEIPGSIGMSMSLVKRMVTREGTTPSLWNILRGVQMVRYRRFLDMDDLFSPPGGPVIPEDNFDAPLETQGEIRRYLKELEKALIPLVKKRDKLRRSSLKGNSQTPDTVDDLQLFYDFSDDLSEQASKILKGSQQGIRSKLPEKVDFSHDKSFPLILTLRFSQRCVESLGPLLSGTVPSSEGIIRLFSQDMFGFYFDKIRPLIPELVGLTEERGTDISMEQWIGLNKRTAQQLSEGDRTVKSTLETILQSLTMVRDVLSRVLQSHSPRDGGNPPPPVAPRDLSSQGVSIPYLDGVIEQQDILLGKSVSEALFFAHEVLSQFLSIMQPSAGQQIQGGLDDVSDRIASVVTNISRMGPEAYLRRVRKKFGL